MIAGCDCSRCDRCDTDVATYRTVVTGCDGEQVLPVVRGVTGVTYCPVVGGCDKEQTGPLVRGVTGVTLTWLCTVPWLQGVIESKPYPSYAV